MPFNNPNLGLANVNVYTKINRIMSIFYQDNERKRNSVIYQGYNSVTNLRKMRVNNSNIDHINIYVNTKFGQKLSIPSQDVVRKRNFDVYQGQ